MLDYPLHEEFFEDVRLLGGGLYPMTIQRVSDREFPALDFSPPRLICRTRLTSRLKVGDVIERVGVKFILAEHSTTPDYRSFWMFQANRKIVWKTVTKTTDTLTGLPKSNALSAGTEIWVGWEIMTRQPYERAIGVPNEMSRVITGSNVLLNDIVDGQQVKRKNIALGLSVLEVS